MAQVEPMDIDAIESDFDNKENAFHCKNVLSRTPCTEKGYEELDVSELNMKLRYSITPASSPMSRSLTGPCLDNRNFISDDYPNNPNNGENGNLTRSLNSTLSKSEGSRKSKVLPLQTLSSDPFVESKRNSSIIRSEPTETLIIAVNNINDIDENLSLPSTCSSMPETPEATTPTKETLKPEGSPILRGLKSVLSMFRPSQSPISSTEDKSTKLATLSPVDLNKSEVQNVQASTPVAASKQKDSSSTKRSSPLKESLVFNDDLERELQWKDETTILFKEEKIPVHKLFFQNPITDISNIPKPLATAVEHMDISCDESITANKTMTHIDLNEHSNKNEHAVAVESDNEFLDCETTFTKNESDHNKSEIDNEVLMTGNITVDLLKNAENSREIKFEQTKILNNTNCKHQCETSMSARDCPPKIYKDNVDVNDTIYLLNNESNDDSNVNHNADISQNIDFQSKSQVNMNFQLDDPNITVPVEEQIAKNNNLNAVEIGMENFVSHNLEGKENSNCEYQVCSNIDNLPDVCIETLSTTDNSKEIQNETSNTIDIKENIGLTDDIPVIVRDLNVLDNSPSNNVAINETIVDIISNIPNTEKRDLTNDSASTQYIENTDLLINNKDISVALDRETPVGNKGLHDIVNNNEAFMNENHKISENMSVTIELPSVKYFVDPTNSPSAQSDLTYELNVTNVDINARVPEIDVTAIEAVQTLKQNVESSVDNTLNFDFLANSNLGGNSMLGNDREVPELTVVSNMTDLKTPSEIPLPDEDDAEQNILGYNTCMEISNRQNNTFEICGDNSISDVGNQLSVDCTKYDQANLNPCDENVEPTTINFGNDHNVDIDKEGNNLAQTFITNKSINMSGENLEEGIVICNLKNARDNNDELMYKNIYSNIENSPEIAIDDSNSMNTVNNKVNNIMEDKVPSNDTEEVPSIIENNLIFNTANKNIDPSEETNETKIRMNEIKFTDDKQQNFISEKDAVDIDEEIITSANNSPYVSVTDLDVDGEMLEDPTENIGSLDTNNKFPSSPPKSPIIVSKGYDFNFDEIDDPFATKTKIRTSPTPDTPNQCLSLPTDEIKMPQVSKNNSRINSQTKPKRQIQKKNKNSTFSDQSTSNNESTTEKSSETALDCPVDNIVNDISTLIDKKNVLVSKHENLVATAIPKCVKTQKVDNSNESIIISAGHESTPVKREEIVANDGDIKNIENPQVISNEKSTSSSEQYFSLGTSSCESSLISRSKNVFNLPEIDDLNFNPFATKSKMRVSPPPKEIPTTSLKAANDVNISSLDQQSELNNTKTVKDPNLTFNNKNINETSPNTSNATCSSKNTNDIDCTVREILTEDEDTVEGPFLETDDLQDSEKKCDVEVKTDMISFGDLPQQERDENLENSELFIDADAFEFLLNQNKNTTVLDSGKESLFLKFDPLFAKRVSSDGILAALGKVQKRQSTPKKVTKVTQKDVTSIEKSTAGPSNNVENYGPAEDYNEDQSSTITKPMMVVNPAVSSIITQKKSAAPKINRRSLTFTSPAMAVIDRLLSLSDNSSHLDHDTSIPQIGREHSETDLAITQLRELLAEKEINVHTLRSESKVLKDRLAALEVQVRGLETESAERLAKINELNDRLSEKTKMNKSMAIVVEEYERTIASLIAETEQDKKRNAEERMRLIKERDEQTAHLTSMEVSFSDLHSKYEKSKQIILSCKSNEDVYKKSIKEFQDNFSKMQNNYELLKQHATSKLNHANQELEKMNRAHEAEVLKMNALIKRKELHITSLEETLAQKTKANEELTAICDELINKVG